MASYIIPVGISGSGKSYLGDRLQEKFHDLAVVCMDDIRRDLTGSVSDQSKNKQVYIKSQEEIQYFLKRGTDVFESATNLSGGKNGLVDKVKKFPGVNCIIVFLTDSLDPELCLKRVMDALENNVDRSATPKDVVYNQYERFKKIYDENWLAERSHYGFQILEYTSRDSRSLDRIIKAMGA
jgi:shikimate kinase